MSCWVLLVESQEDEKLKIKMKKEAVYITKH